MKKQTRIYNVIFPIWILILFPQLLVFVIPGNLIVDCAVLWFTLLALKHARKEAVVKQLWWKFWLLGFAADAIGVAWMFLGVLPMMLGDSRQPGPWDIPWLADAINSLMTNTFRHPLAFLWTLAGVALAGVCIYFFDRRAMKSCELLDGRQRHIVALVMAIVTAPWLFFIPTRP